MIILLSGICTFGCNRAKVTTGELAGTWVLTDASRIHLPRDFQKASSKITLEANGSFVATELPGEILYVTPERRDRLVSGRGIWKVNSQGGAQQVKLEFHEIAEAREDAVPFTTELRVSRAGSVPVLFYYHGDEDVGLRVKFEKR